MTARLVNEKILSQITGVIHVGANIGQERHYYAMHDLNVLWFEPNPEAYRTLRENIAGYPKQRAVPQLLASKDYEWRTLHITSGSGQCSSIFDLAEHAKYYPEIQYVRQEEMESFTLDTFVSLAEINLNLYQFLVLDTQMADLLVLEGAVETLRHLQFVEVETSPLELYKGGCLEHEVIEFLDSQGYKEKERVVATNINNHILFERETSGTI